MPESIIATENAWGLKHRTKSLFLMVLHFEVEYGVYMLNRLDQKMIFIVGNSRSGTTMMVRALDRHPEVNSFNELHFFEEMWSKKDATKLLTEFEAIRLASHILSTCRDGYLLQKNEERFADESKTLLKHVRKDNLFSHKVFEEVLFYETRLRNKVLSLEKTPRNVFYIKEILELFPNAKIINMVRDPRSIILSQKNKWKRKSLGANYMPMREVIRLWVNYHPITMSLLWNSSIRAAELFKDDDRILTVRFEDVMEEPEKVVQKICDFLGILYHSYMLDVPHVESSIAPDCPDKKGIDKKRAGSWQAGGLDVAEIFYCQSICGTYMIKYGYQRIIISFSPVRVLYYAFTFPLKICAALFLNLHRMRNVFETLKKRLG